MNFFQSCIVRASSWMGQPVAATRPESIQRSAGHSLPFRACFTNHVRTRSGIVFASGLYECCHCCTTDMLNKSNFAWCSDHRANTIVVPVLNRPSISSNVMKVIITKEFSNSCANRCWRSSVYRLPTEVPYISECLLLNELLLMEGLRTGMHVPVSFGSRKAAPDVIMFERIQTPSKISLFDSLMLPLPLRHHMRRMGAWFHILQLF